MPPLNRGIHFFEILMCSSRCAVSGFHSSVHAKLLQRHVTAQGKLCNGTLRWINDTFTTALRTALADKAIDLPTSDALTLSARHMFTFSNWTNASNFMEFLIMLPELPSLAASSRLSAISWKSQRHSRKYHSKLWQGSSGPGSSQLRRDLPLHGHIVAYCSAPAARCHFSLGRTHLFNTPVLLPSSKIYFLHDT